MSRNLAGFFRVSDIMFQVTIAWRKQMKFIITAIISLLIASSAMACGGSANPTSSTTSPTTSDSAGADSDEG